jgi:threonine synthase
MKSIQVPCSAIAQKLGLSGDVFLKREDTHKYGSHKGRSIPLMVKKYFKEEGITNFVISSSGNAALAAIHAIQVHNRNNPSKLKLTVFVGLNIDSAKLKMLLAVINDPNVKLEQVERPKQTAFGIDKEKQAKLLRQSTDENALAGYFELAQELDKIPNLKAIFVPTSSGTTAQGLGEAFQTEFLQQNPQIHIVQTNSCHPIVEHFQSDYIKNNPYAVADKSIAGAIVDKTAFRKEKVIETVETSEGSGWIVENDDIKEAMELSKKGCHVAISPNSALSLAGLKKAVENDFSWDGNIVCLITGM